MILLNTDIYLGFTLRHVLTVPTVLGFNLRHVVGFNIRNVLGFALRYVLTVLGLTLRHILADLGFTQLLECKMTIGLNN